MTLQDLIARVDKAKGPDRALDHDLGAFLGLPTRRVARGEAPRLCYTRSVEQSAWLAEKVRPGWDWSIGSLKDTGGYHAELFPERDEPTDYTEYGNTPALALIRVVLSTLGD